MLGARLGRRQAGLGRLASLRPLGWHADALDRRLEVRTERGAAQELGVASNSAQ